MLTGEEELLAEAAESMEVETHEAVRSTLLPGRLQQWAPTRIVYMVSRPPAINNSTSWPYSDPARLTKAGVELGGRRV